LNIKRYLKSEVFGKAGFSKPGFFVLFGSETQ